MPKFTVNVAQKRWEHASFTVEADTPEAAVEAAQAEIDSGELWERDMEWDGGDACESDGLLLEVRDPRTDTLLAAG